MIQEDKDFLAAIAMRSIAIVCGIGAANIAPARPTWPSILLFAVLVAMAAFSWEVAEAIKEASHSNASAINAEPGAEAASQKREVVP